VAAKWAWWTFRTRAFYQKYAGRGRRHGPGDADRGRYESIKQQTREPLAILDLMEVPHLIAVITQSDLADADQITLVGMEIDDLLKPTRFRRSAAGRGFSR